MATVCEKLPFPWHKNISGPIRKQLLFKPESYYNLPTNNWRLPSSDMYVALVGNIFLLFPHPQGPDVKQESRTVDIQNIELPGNVVIKTNQNKINVNISNLRLYH